jgi:hypothetical protein
MARRSYNGMDAQKLKLQLGGSLRFLENSFEGGAMGYEKENQGLGEVPVFVFHCTFMTKFFEWVLEMPFFPYVHLCIRIVLAFYIRGLFKLICLESQDF